MAKNVLTIYPNELLLVQAVSQQKKAVAFYEDVTTLARFINQLLAELPQTWVPLSFEDELLFLKRVIADYSQDPHFYFYSVCQTEGFLEHLQKCISECKKALLFPKKILELAKQHPVEADKRRLEAIGLLYDAYQKKLEGHAPPLWERDDAEWRLVSALQNPAWQPKIFQGVHRLNFLWLTTLTPLRFALFKAIAEWMQRKGGEVDLSIVYDPQYQEGVFRFSGYTLTKIELLGSVCHAINPPDFFSPSGKRKAGITALLQKIAKRYPYVRSQEEPQAESLIQEMQQQIHLLQARSIVDEVEAIAREIRQMIQEGTPPEEMIVVVPDLSAYGEVIEEVFQQWKIPLTFRRGKPLLSNPFVRSLLSVYFFLRQTLYSDALLRLVTSGYKNLPQSIPAEELAYLLKQCKPSRGVTEFEEAARMWQEAFEAFRQRAQTQRQAPKAHLGEIKKAARDLKCVQSCAEPIKKLFKQIEPLARSQTVAEHVEAFLKLLQKWQVEQFLARRADFQMARDQLSWRMLLQTLGTLEQAESRLGEKYTISPQAFLSLLMSSLKKKAVAFRDPLKGVRVLKPNDMVGLAAQAVFVLGLTSEHFPKRHYESPLLSESLKVWLNEKLLEDEKPFKRRAFMSLSGRYLEEAFFFFLSIQAAQARLTLSRYLMDANEISLEASPYFQTVEAILGRKEKNCVEESTPLLVFEECSNGLAVLSYLAPYLARQSKEEEQESEDGFIFSALLRNPDWRKAAVGLKRIAKIEQSRSRFFLLEEAEKRETGNPYSGTCASFRVKEWIEKLLQAHLLSPTAMETFGQCPFRFLGQRLLNVSLEEEVGDEMDSLMSGAFYHAVLERYFQTKKKRGEQFFESSDRELLQATIDAVSREWQESFFLGVHPILFELKKEEVFTNLRRVLNQIADAYQGTQASAIGESSVFGVEVELKCNGTLETVAIQGKESLPFQGRIDAVFVVPYGKEGKVWEVVDFKATPSVVGSGNSYSLHFHPEGKKKNGLGNIGIVGWQLPIYALSVKQFLKKEGRGNAAIGIAYWALRAEEKRNTLLRCEWGETEEALFQKNASSTLEQVLRGGFTVAPIDPKICCHYCSCRKICRHPEAMEQKSYG